jgi:hypothetical protein
MDELQPKPAPEGEMPTVELDSDSAKILADLGSILRDLEFVVGCCDRLLPMLEDEDRDAVTIEALWTAALVAYARCFASGKRFGLDEDSFVGLEGEVVAFHRLLLNLRNKHIAHSVNPFEVVRIGAILSPLVSQDKKVEGIATLAMKHIAGDGEAIQGVAGLARSLRIRVAQLGTDRLRVVREEAEQCDIASLYRLPRLRTTAPGPEQSARAR